MNSGRPVSSLDVADLLTVACGCAALWITYPAVAAMIDPFEQPAETSLVQDRQL